MLFLILSSLAIIVFSRVNPPCNEFTYANCPTQCFRCEHTHHHTKDCSKRDVSNGAKLCYPGIEDLPCNYYKKMSECPGDRCSVCPTYPDHGPICTKDPAVDECYQNKRKKIR